ncbi:MAG: MBL fold metallo-hydrolase [Mesorhizobium sp.]|nr:MAG: MBL fold metallo-hydrolase [Mesorhizobium sp.]TIO64641.1 MAG: MBL fold metallo-hydrolase [Mesorhizobium sp.]TJV82660.1 MAG: MBL fold metallo-hydrolase [Mesorhizobium sp.]
MPISTQADIFPRFQPGHRRAIYRRWAIGIVTWKARSRIRFIVNLHLGYGVADGNETHDFDPTLQKSLGISGRDALLIDTGSGAVMRHLVDIGVDQVDWVLHTHHHRDQCWGTKSVQKAYAKIAVPEFERHLFDNVEVHWQTRRSTTTTTT